MFQRKFDNIYENNILIAKSDSGSSNQNSAEGEQQRNQNAALANIQEEIRKLHGEKSQKDNIIHKLKAYVKQICAEQGIDEEEAE